MGMREEEVCFCIYQDRRSADGMERGRLTDTLQGKRGQTRGQGLDGHLLQSVLAVDAETTPLCVGYNLVLPLMVLQMNLCTCMQI